MKRYHMLITMLVLGSLAACSSTASPTPTPARLKVGVVLGFNNEDDKGFHEYTLKGAREAAQAANLEFTYVGSNADSFEKDITRLIEEGADLIITVGFVMSDATATTARQNPAVRFAIVDAVFAPGAGCPETVSDCYSDGGMGNVTSLAFAEDEVGYLAGVLGGCMSKTGTIASVAGRDIPPVVRFVTGYQNGAKSVNPAIITLNKYIPDFNDTETGRLTGQEFIDDGADVIFAVGGETGNGGLLAAKEAGIMGIGVDVDQYLTFPEVKEILLSSAKKNVDVAAGEVVREFAAGTLKGGIRQSTVASGGVGLAPYHDWDSRIPQSCKDQVSAAEAAIKANPAITGGK